MSAPSRLLATATVLAVAVSATALAAKPKANARFKGSVTDARYKINGFPPPVSFTVNSSSTALKRFTFGSIGCSGSGGAIQGNPWKGYFLIHAGTVRVSSSGQVNQVKTAKVPIKGAGPSGKTETTTLTTKVTIKAKFSTARKIAGTIAIAQSFKFSFQPQPQRCTGNPEPFSAKAS